MKVLLLIFLMLPGAAICQVTDSIKLLDEKNGYKEYTFGKDFSEFSKLRRSKTVDTIQFYRTPQNGFTPFPWKVLGFNKSNKLCRLELQYGDDVFTDLIRTFGTYSEFIWGAHEKLYYWYGEKITMVYEMSITNGVAANILVGQAIPVYKIYYDDIPGKEYKAKRQKQTAKDF